ncbi:MAG TPA: hypothetical protein VHX37_01660 [Acidobacteriaceae bacterium]|jgi:Flp pilus assembly pilin Flp|nr:hypothetical protein [Acidobacteriaceae bacterium]
MLWLVKWFWKLLHFHGGADALEFAMIAAVLLLAVIAAQGAMAMHIVNEFTLIGNSI